MNHLVNLIFKGSIDIVKDITTYSEKQQLKSESFWINYANNNPIPSVDHSVIIYYGSVSIVWSQSKLYAGKYTCTIQSRDNININCIPIMSNEWTESIGKMAYVMKELL